MTAASRKDRGRDNPDPAALEDTIRRRDTRRLAIAFAGAVLLHASAALSLTFWEPPEPVAPPGDLVITLDIEPAAFSAATAASAGVSAESAPQEAKPPEPPLEEAEDKASEETPPVPETVETEMPEPPKAETADVVIAPKEQKEEKKKPTPKPAPASQAAAAASEKRSDVSGRGASASPTEINEYAGRVRAAIERRKSKPASAGNASGTVHVAFTIARSGGATGIRLSSSSGTPALDAAARAAVASAGIPPVPEGLPAPMNFGVPINFR